MHDGSGKSLKAAEFIDRQHREKERFRPFAAELGIASIEDAYVAQKAYLDLIHPTHEMSRAGFKVGLTSRRIQEMCGLDSPVTGVVLKERVHQSGATLRLSEFGRIGLEFEIAVLLGQDLHPRTEPYSRDEVARAVASIAPAIEVVDDRDCDYSTLDAFSLVADNSWNAGVILGSFTGAEGIDLTSRVGVVSLDGREIDRGRGADVLGGPFAVLEWLANNFRQRDIALHAGDIVMTGSLVPTQFPSAGSSYRFDLSGLGAVELRIES